MINQHKLARKLKQKIKNQIRNPKFFMNTEIYNKKFLYNISIIIKVTSLNSNSFKNNKFFR